MPKTKAISRLLDRVADAKTRHEQRHRPSGFGFAFADSIDYLDGSRWDALCLPASFFLQRAYLRVLEKHAPANLSQRYAMVFDGEDAVAGVAAQILSLTAANVVNPNMPAGKSGNGSD